MSPPGTISGAPDPDDRLRAELAERGGHFGPRPSPPTGDGSAETPWAGQPMAEALLFLAIVLVAGLFAMSLLAKPIQDLLAATLTALGLPVDGPSSYAPGARARLFVTQPETFIVQIAGGQLVFGGLALAGAIVLGGGIRRRLGLVRPRGGWRVLGVAVVLEVLAIFFGGFSVFSVLPSGFETPERNLQLVTMIRETPFAVFLLMLAAASLLPGLCEESLFRGLIQRRLLQGWSPAAAIVVTGIVFTILHPPLVRSLILLPACLWLGYVAWRCGSILPGIVLHAGTNAGVQLFMRFAPLEGPVTYAPTNLERAVSAGIALACAALATWLLILVHRWTRIPAPASS